MKGRSIASQHRGLFRSLELVGLLVTQMIRATPASAVTITNGDRKHPVRVPTVMNLRAHSKIGFSCRARGRGDAGPERGTVMYLHRLSTLFRALPVIAILVAQVVLSPIANANPGDLDPTFGVAGRVTTDFAIAGSSDDQASALAIQPDGKIVVVGTSFFVAPGPAPGRDVVLSRYNPDGSLDPSFGTGGKVATSLGANQAGAEDMTLQADGEDPGCGVYGHSDGRRLRSRALQPRWVSGHIVRNGRCGLDRSLRRRRLCRGRCAAGGRQDRLGGRNPCAWSDERVRPRSLQPGWIARLDLRCGRTRHDRRRLRCPRRDHPAERQDRGRGSKHE